MNPNVAVNAVCTDGLLEWTKYDVVVLVNCDWARMELVSSAVVNGISTRLVCSGVYGVLAYCFCDFGPIWEVSDLDGELPASGVCLGVNNNGGGGGGGLEVHTERRHGLVAGDHVRFIRAKTTTPSVPSGPAPFQVVRSARPSATTFTVRPNAAAVASDVTWPHAGAYFEEVKPSAVLLTSHVPLSQSVLNPRFSGNADDDADRSSRLFSLLRHHVWQHQTTSNDDEEARHILHSLPCPAVASFMGGVAAQEVIKAATGKFTPLDQWLVFAPNAEFLPLYRALPQHQHKLGALRVFVVGAGALGCELVKHLVLLNACQRAQGGRCVITDPDSIEKSNLSRQFLFREHNVGKNKAEEAARACRAVSSSFNVTALDLRVDSEPVALAAFDDAFWADIDVVINALDNVPSRRYVDSLCVHYGKPLLESGTLGTKANALPIVPYVTESYGSDGGDGDTGGGEDIPACTLRAYPNLFEHCLVWARDTVFEAEFSTAVADAKQFMEQGADDEQPPPPVWSAERLRAVRILLVGRLPQDSAELPVAVAPVRNAADCVAAAKLKFTQLFQSKIELLLKQHPADEVEEEEEDAQQQQQPKRRKFWSGKRRVPPVAVEFDASNALHVLFVTSMAKLLARACGGSIDDGGDVLVKGSTLSVLPAAELPPSNTLEQDWALLLKYRRGATAATPRRFTPLAFDKDNDEHVDLVWSAACVRASNYSIPPQTRLDSKRVVGRIIPALATTTAAVCGLVALELLKLVLSSATPPPLALFRSWNLNLAVNWYGAFHPVPCPRTLWRTIDLVGDLTVQQFVHECAQALRARGWRNVITRLFTTADGVTLYVAASSGDASSSSSKVSMLYRQLVGRDPPAVFIPLAVDCEEEEKDLLPSVRLRWNNIHT